jgi:hypothetical protein
MSASMTTKVVGGKEAILALRRIDPELRKQFTRDAKEIAKPATDAVKTAYQTVPLSGMERNWSQKGRKIFPFTIAGARRGVGVKVDTRRNSENVILIEQKNVAAAVFETAGRKNDSDLAKNLGTVRPGRTRVIGPVVYSRRNDIAQEMQRLITRTIRLVERKLP